jgi:hypothetical protein
MADAIAQIDAEIVDLQEKLSNLQQAKALLSGSGSATVAAPAVKSGRGRPKGSKNASKIAEVSSPAKAAKAPAKRTLSPEGRKAIAEAMKRRWAERREKIGK